MMELIRQWLLGVACAAMVLALAESLAPAGGVKKVCRLAGGMVLLLAAISPVLKLDEGALSRALSEYRITGQGYEDVLAEKNQLLYKTIIEENTAAYILDKAEELGISCQAEVSVAYDEDGFPYPWSVTVSGSWTEEQESQLSLFLETDLDISVQRQQLERIQP